MIKYDLKTYDRDKGEWDTFEYLTNHLVEEMSEVTKAISKINRWGKLKFWAKEDRTNIDCLRNEINDVEIIISKLKKTDEYNEH